jgi:hypothetical protein
VVFVYKQQKGFEVEFMNLTGEIVAAASVKQINEALEELRKLITEE